MLTALDEATQTQILPWQILILILHPHSASSFLPASSAHRQFPIPSPPPNSITTFPILTPSSTTAHVAQINERKFYDKRRKKYHQQVAAGMFPSVRAAEKADIEGGKMRRQALWDKQKTEKEREKQAGEIE